jgi:gamma-glutamyl phosphate reductase
MKMILNEIIQKLKADNPEPYGQTNGVKYKMEGDELEAYYAASAQIILNENQKEAEIASKATEKAAILDRLGLTADEAKLLLS